MLMTPVKLELCRASLVLPVVSACVLPVLDPRNDMQLWAADCTCCKLVQHHHAGRCTT